MKRCHRALPREEMISGQEVTFPSLGVSETPFPCCQQSVGSWGNGLGDCWADGGAQHVITASTAGLESREGYEGAGPGMRERQNLLLLREQGSSGEGAGRRKKEGMAPGTGARDPWRGLATRSILESPGNMA